MIALFSVHSHPASWWQLPGHSTRPTENSNARRKGFNGLVRREAKACLGAAIAQLMQDHFAAEQAVVETRAVHHWRQLQHPSAPQKRPPRLCERAVGDATVTASPTRSCHPRFPTSSPTSLCGSQRTGSPSSWRTASLSKARPRKRPRPRRSSGREGFPSRAAPAQRLCEREAMATSRMTWRRRRRQALMAVRHLVVGLRRRRARAPSRHCANGSARCLRRASTHRSRRGAGVVGA